MTLIADVFLETPAPKNMVRWLSKKPCFRGPLDRQQGKWLETPLAILMAGPLKYLLITVNVVALEKVSFNDTQNPTTVS